VTDMRTIVEGLGGVLAIAGAVALSPLLSRWYRRWGATEEETGCSLPGDELAPRPRSVITCAITVQMPVRRVWPWLVQIGCRRAGWYSYDLLDNGGQPSADRLLPEYQHLAVRDEVLLTPKGPLAMPVVALEPEKALVLGGTLNTRTGKEWLSANHSRRRITPASMPLSWSRPVPRPRGCSFASGSTGARLWPAR
jgi:hypothetical protein